MSIVGLSTPNGDEVSFVLGVGTSRSIIGLLVARTRAQRTYVLVDTREDFHACVGLVEHDMRSIS